MILLEVSNGLFFLHLPKTFKMKTVVAVVILFLSSSFIFTSNDENDSNILVGKVKLDTKGCGVKIKIKSVSNGEKWKTVYPVNLDEKFRKNNLKIKANFVLSRQFQPENCKVDAVVSLLEIETF